MAKALFLGLPLHGHTNPSLPLVRALVERGDEVVYFSGDTFADGILKTGARYRGYQVPFLANLRQLSERTDEMAWLLTRTTGEVLGRHLDAFRVESADYIIRGASGSPCRRSGTSGRRPCSVAGSGASTASRVPGSWV